MIDLPSQDDLNQFKPFEVVAAPKGLDDVIYNPEKTKEEYLTEGWCIQKVITAPENIQHIGSELHATRRQYGIKHHVTCTIHSSMGDTLHKVAMEFSSTEEKFKLWEKAQVVVGISRTKRGKDTILVGDKESILDALELIILQRSQWSDYEEAVLRIITINNEDNDGPIVFCPPTTFPFRVRDLELPNCMTGFVYFLISVNDHDRIYIGETEDLGRRLKQHNSGNGTAFTKIGRPYAVFAYVCGFNANQDVRKYFEDEWKNKRDEFL